MRFTPISYRIVSINIVEKREDGPSKDNLGLGKRMDGKAMSIQKCVYNI
jgi:hypothetical protein